MVFPLPDIDLAADCVSFSWDKTLVFVPLMAQHSSFRCRTNRLLTSRRRNNWKKCYTIYGAHTTTVSGAGRNMLQLRSWKPTVLV